MTLALGLNVGGMLLLRFRSFACETGRVAHTLVAGVRGRHLSSVLRARARGAESEPEGEHAYNDEHDNGQELPYFSKIVARILGLLQKY